MLRSTNDISEKQKLLRKLLAVRFALIDCTLYLDSHPTCAEGLRYYRQKRAEADKLTQEYEETYGALTAASSRADDKWEWSTTAFPWERGES